MKKTILVLMLLCAGCTTIKYGELEYMRLGGQTLDNFSATKLDDGSILVEFDKYSGEGVAPIVGAAVEGAVRGMK